MKLDFHAVVCAYCNRPFTALSNQARYCSDACRSAAARQRKRHSTNEPVPGLRGNAAVMFVDVIEASPTAAAVIRAIREKRGISAARDAVYVAVAAMIPAVADAGTAYRDYYIDGMPDYLKGALE